MKEFIVIIAAIMLLMVFVMQYSIQQVNDYKLNAFQQHVYVAKEKAKLSGMFTTEIKNELVNSICDTFKDISESEIIIDVTDDVKKYRTNEFDERELIHYRIGVPINKIIAAAKFFGISDEHNKGYYIIEGETTSELIMP
jgi:hypothetical protein